MTSCAMAGQNKQSQEPVLWRYTDLGMNPGIAIFRYVTLDK